jgi:hypothetical protein
MIAAVSESPVRLQLAAHQRYLRVARAAASSLGAANGFDVEELDDLRIAVDELCSALLELGDTSGITLEIADHEGTIVVRGRAAAEAGSLARWNDEHFGLARQILRVVATEYHLEEREGQLCFVLRQEHRP